MVFVALIWIWLQSLFFGFLQENTQLQKSLSMEYLFICSFKLFPRIKILCIFGKQCSVDDEIACYINKSNWDFIPCTHVPYVNPTGIL